LGGTGTLQPPPPNALEAPHPRGPAPTGCGGGHLPQCQAETTRHRYTGGGTREERGARGGPCLGVTSWGGEGAILQPQASHPGGRGDISGLGDGWPQRCPGEWGGKGWGLLCPPSCPSRSPCAGEKRGTPTGSGDLGICDLGTQGTWGHGDTEDRGRGTQGTGMWGCSDRGMGGTGRGEWGHRDTGIGDAGTLGYGDMGTQDVGLWGCMGPGDVGLRGHGVTGPRDTGTWGVGDTGTQLYRGRRDVGL